MLDKYKISPHDPALCERVKNAIDAKTKPPGSLGRIEELALTMAACQNTDAPAADPARLLIFAGDHGLAAEGVSAWPSEVTTQMVGNFLAGGAAANVFARTNGVDITIADAGIAGDLPDHPDLMRAGLRRGTRNALNEDAMTASEAEALLEFGAGLAVDAVGRGAKVILVGEMGIGNTSSATLIAHALEDIPIEELTGPGASLDGAGVAHKIAILKQVAARRPGRFTAFEALAAFGGLEIAAMAGAIIGAASARAVVLIDGFIATSAALCAIRGRHEVAAYTVFSHRSKEPGHRAVMAAIGANPLIDLDLRLGEGTGALLAFPLLRNACSMLNDMATFASAGVTNSNESQS